MIEKLLAELSKATVWMPAQVLKDKVGARNTTNVSLRLRDLEKNGSVVSRSRTEAGAKVVEWRHADKVNAGDLPPAGRATKAAPVVQDSLTTEMPTDKECCNAAKVVATTAGAEVAALNKQLAAKDEWIDAAKRKIADLENNGADQRAKLEEAERLNIQWLGLAREFNAEGIDGLRGVMNRANDAERNWEVAMMAAIGEDGTGSVTEAIAGLKETIKQQRSTIDAKDTEIGINDAAVDGWLDLAMEFECKSIPELRVFIDSALIRIEALKKAKTVAPRKPAQPRQPFSVTGLVGYHAGGDKVTLFLNRRLSSRSVTFPADKMAQLVDMAREAS